MVLLAAELNRFSYFEKKERGYGETLHRATLKRFK
jgi:hypothetical protein